MVFQSFQHIHLNVAELFCVVRREEFADAVVVTDACARFLNRVKHLELFRKQRTVLETRMAELQQTMDTLDYKCWFYETAAARGSTEGISDLPDEALPEALRPVRERLRTAAETETEEV